MSKHFWRGPALRSSMFDTGRSSSPHPDCPPLGYRSNTIVPAPIASDHQALAALVDEVLVCRGAHFAVPLLTPFAESPELLVVALAIITTMIDRMLDLLSTITVLVGGLATVDVSLRARDQAFFVPLWTTAVLPRYPAHVAELTPFDTLAFMP